MKYKIKEIGRVVTGCTPKTKNEEYYKNKDYMFVGPTDIKSCKYVRSLEKYISNTAYIDYSNKFIDSKSIMVDCIGSDMGNVALSVNKVLTNQQINSITEINENRFNVEYIYYVLSNMKKYFHQIGTNGSTMPIINKTMFEEIEIEVPKKCVQDKIVNVLRSIDKKIELNNKINNNLYEISKRLYKRWFIDYEFPNEYGKPYKSSGGKMIVSDIGEIPENWEVKQLDELVNVINGYSYKGKELVEESNTGMATIKNFDRTGGFKLDGYKPMNPEKIKEQQVVEVFELVVAHTDLTQNADIIGNPVLILNKKNYEKIIISMDLVKVEPKEEKYNKFFIFETLNADRFKKHALGYVSGTTVLHLDKSCIKQYIIAIPENDDKVKKFSQIIKTNYEKIAELIAENQVLEQLRDTLLPKLMDAEIELESIKI